MSDHPAFPQHLIRSDDRQLQSPGAYGPWEGMSMRQYYAAKALQGLCAIPDDTRCQSKTPEDIENERFNYAVDDALSAWRFADAMIATENGDPRKGGA